MFTYPIAFLDSPISPLNHQRKMIFNFREFSAEVDTEFRRFIQNTGIIAP